MDMARVSQDSVREFWDWFRSISTELGSNLDNSEILQELDERIRSFEGITWEVGPGISELNALAFSPNGRKELLSVTKQIVALAPTCVGWEFHPAKPPKNWDLRFVVEDKHGNQVEVDATGWQYALLKFPDGTFDIVVHAPNLPDDEDIRYQAADIAVEGQLGEQTMLQLIQNLDVVDEFEDDLVGKGNSVTVLAEHLASLLKS